MNELVITNEDPFDDRCRLLLGELRSELAQKYPEEIEGTSFDPHDLAGAGSTFLLATLNGEPVGCGGIRPHDPGTAEIKRMFVLSEARGKGVGRRILEQLESNGRQLGYSMLRLETGLKQPEAIALYESSGFRRAKCYGSFANNPLSICFEKVL